MGKQGKVSAEHPSLGVAPRLRWCFPAPQWEWDPYRKVLTMHRLTCCPLALIKVQLLTTTKAAPGFGERVLHFTELTGGTSVLYVPRGRPAACSPGTGSSPLTCRACQHITRGVKIPEEWPDGKALLPASLETVQSVNSSPLRARHFAAMKCVCWVRS